ncbi:hypothetical protein [Solobacterium moorei]|uniref:Uncharacterized protein n=1 Tax=Solobacterium moorei TaxID=102148 RepID=A0A412PAP1_9FIRM|nr:hypothetical protein [Solobacterium moorei]RGT53642.1 hypothetical protein DWX20_09390 [Solobacterium moorei]
MQGIYALYRHRLFNFSNIMVNFMIFLLFLAFMQIPENSVQELVGIIFFFIFQVQLITILIDENWNPILQILPVRKKDYFNAYMKITFVWFFIYVLCTIWFNTVISKLSLLFVLAPISCLYYCLRNFKKMTTVKSNNMLIRYVLFIVVTILFTWIRNQLVFSDSILVFGNLGCIAVFSIMLFACMYEIRGEESL